MWFRPRSQPNHETSDRSRVASSIRNRIRSKKSVTKNEVTNNQDAKELNVTITKPIPTTPNRIRDVAAAVADGSGYVLRSQSGRRLSVLCSDDDDTLKDKNKVLRVDQKYKKNRITKSSSRTKVVPELVVEKPNSGKSSSNCPANQRKVSSTPLLEPTTKVKTARRNTTLNLNALLRYKSFISGSKKLTPDDFDRLRRKSLGDTGKIRRKSNPDADKKDDVAKDDVDSGGGDGVEAKKDLPIASSFDSDKYLSDEDVFQSCSEDQVYDIRNSLSKPDKGCNISSTTTKKTKTKTKKKG